MGVCYVGLVLQHMLRKKKKTNQTNPIFNTSAFVPFLAGGEYGGRHCMALVQMGV